RRVLAAQIAASNPGGDPRLAPYMPEQDAGLVGRGPMKEMGLKLRPKGTVSRPIYPGHVPMPIRGVYVAKKQTLGAATMVFHFRYLEQKGMRGEGQAGLYVLDLTPNADAGALAKQIDTQFENSSAQTLTESEQAFQAGFVSMYGNVPFVLRVIGLAVVFAILLIAANTMVTAIRERTREIAVYKTLGFSDGTVVRMVLLEAGLITVGGGTLGALLAKLALEKGGFNLGGFLPPMSVYWSTVLSGIGIAALVGAVSGLIPAWRASQLRIVDALRRVD